MTKAHPLTLYNSLTRRKETFIPQDPKRVTMYNCGPTVYSYAHIGNARAAVVADVLFRVLRHIYGENHVVYARNITDVDDKIIASAKEQGVPISDITEKYARIYNDDLAAIGCLPPTHQPKATDHIDNMTVMISDLIDKGFAYISDSHVFFDVSKYDDYGQLSGNTLAALRGGDRVGEGEVARKRNAADFVLWKPELDGVGWDAPFGKGRPGWHIECSAMAKATLCNTDYGNTIDIHCGGVDLKFPHHENEKAQSCCANDTKTFAKFWVHNEFLNMGNEKMSKSLGNVKLISKLLENEPGEVLRLAIIKASHRSELLWSSDLLFEAREQLDGWYRSLLRIGKSKPNVPAPELMEAITDDLNTPKAIFVLSELGKSLNYKYEEPFDFKSAAGEFIASANLLGLLQKDPEDWFRGNTSEDEEDQINDLIQQRDAAKIAAIAAKKLGDKAAMGTNFKRSDEIRDQLKAQGIVLEDGPDGTTWRRE